MTIGEAIELMRDENAIPDEYAYSCIADMLEELKDYRNKAGGTD